jgi:hypothetical protein
MKNIIIDGMTEMPLKDAVAQFMYKGYLISVSQVFKATTIAVFKDDFAKYNFITAEDAIDFIIEREAK